MQVLHLSQRGCDDGLDALKGSGNWHRHGIVGSLHSRFPQHTRDKKEHRGQDGHAPCRAGTRKCKEIFHNTESEVGFIVLTNPIMPLLNRNLKTTGQGGLGYNKRTTKQSIVYFVPQASPAGEQSEGSSARMETVFATRRALSSGSRCGLSGKWLGDSFTRVFSCGIWRTRRKTSSSMAANTRDLPGTSSPVSPPSPCHSWVSFSPSSSLPEQNKGEYSHQSQSHNPIQTCGMLAPDPCSISFAEDVPVQP